MRVSFITKRLIFSLITITLLVLGVISISKAKASFFSNILSLFSNNLNSNQENTEKKVLTSENLLKPKASYLLEENDKPTTINSDGTLVVQSGSLRVSTEKEKVLDGIISLYEVKSGDTLDTIAKLFGISKNTIIWANDLKSKNVKPGETLLIFPINGVEYKVKNGGTIYDIANKYKADANEIAEYNGLAIDTKLAKGDTIFIPDAEAEIQVNTKTSTTKTTPKYKNNVILGYFMSPISGCVKTQGLHGPYHSAVDFGCKVGTPVVAAHDGAVIRADGSGYNGGYGKVVIISHPNGTQSIYAHLSQINVATGKQVTQGEVIGATGNTGKSTGPHLHFETRGTGNPFQ